MYQYNTGKVRTAFAIDKKTFTSRPSVHQLKPVNPQ